MADGFVAPANEIENSGFIAPKEEIISPSNNPVTTENGSVDKTPIVKNDPLDPLRNIYFKEQFEGQEIYDPKKVEDRVNSELSFIQDPNTTSDKIAERASEEIGRKYAKIAEIKTDIKPYITPGLFHEPTIKAEKEDPERKRNIEKEIGELKQFYTGARMLKNGLGYQDVMMAEPEDLDKLTQQIDSRFLKNSGIEINNTGNLKQERLNKIAATSMFGAFNPMISKVDAQTFLVDGAEFQKSTIQRSIEQEKKKQEEKKQEISDFNEQIGERAVSEEEQKQLDNIQAEYDKSVQRQLKKTQLIDKIDSIVNTEAPDYQKHQKDIEKMNNILLTKPIFSNYIYQPWLAVKKVVADELIGGITSLSARGLDLAEDIHRDVTYQEPISDEELSLRDLKYASFRNGFRSQLGLPNLNDKTAFLNKQLTGFDDEGKFYFHLNLLTYNVGKTTLESYAMGAPAAAFESKLAQLFAMSASTHAMFADDMIHQENLQGLNPRLAAWTGLVRSEIEAVTEMANPIEIAAAKGFIKEGVNLSVNDAKKIAYRDVIREITGTSKWDKIAAKLYDAKVFGKEFARVSSMEYLEEFLADVSNKLPDYWAKNANPDYQTQDNLNLKQQLISYLTVTATMLPMAGQAGFSKVRDTNLSARMMIGSTPKVYLDQLNEDLKKGKITQERYNQSLDILNHSATTYINLKPEFDKIDKLNIGDAEKEGRKLELYSEQFKIEALQEEMKKPMSDERRTELENNILKSSENLTKKKVEYTTPITPEQEVKRQKDEKIEHLNKEYPDEYIKKFENKERLQTFKSDFENVIAKETDEKIKELYQEKLNLINTRLAELEKPKPEEQKISVAKEEINTLSKEEAENLLDLSKIQEKYPDLKPEEPEELFSHVMDRIDNLLNEEKKIQPFKDRTGKEFQLTKEDKIVINSGKGDEVFLPTKYEDGKLYGKYLDGSQEIVVNPNEAEISLDKERIDRVLKPETKEEVKTETPEVKIGNILSQNISNEEKVQLLQKGKEESIKSEYKKLGETDINKPYTEEFKQKAIEIAKKYDEAMIKLTPQKSIEEIQKEAVEERKVEEKEQKEEVAKTEEFNAKKSVNDILSTQGNSEKFNEKTGKFEINTDESVIRWENTLKSIKEEAETEGRSYDKLGYFIKVVSSSKVPITDKTKSSADWEAKASHQEIENAVNVIITDKEGNPLLFNIDGKKVKTREEGGKLAVGTLPKVNESKGVYSAPSLKLQKVPANEEQGALKRLFDLRRDKDKVYSIEKITDGWSEKEKKTQPLSEVGKEDYNIGIALTKLDGFNAGQSYVIMKGFEFKIPITVDKIGEDLARAMVDFFYNAPEEGFTNEFGKSIDILTYNDESKGLYFHAKREKGERGIYWNYDTDKRVVSREEAILKLANKTINISKKQIYGNYIGSEKSVDIPYTENGETKFKTTNYKQFLAGHITLNLPTNKTNRYAVLGNEVAKEEIPTVSKKEIVEKPKEEIPENPLNPKREPKPTIQKKQDNGFLNNLQRSKKLEVIETTPQQEKEAEEWFNSHPLSKHINFRDFRNTVNSDAWATFSTSATTLWKGGKFTDLYHEAWHNFTQLFLTKQQKRDLYKEVNPNKSYREVEEILAEDFLKYVLSGQKLILNNRVKRNTIFRKIYNFLKELFTGRVDLQTYYERLYKGNINKYLKQLNTDNALFGTLNRAIEDDKGRKLSIPESKDLVSHIDRAIASEFEAKNTPITSLFTQKGELNRLYNYLNEVVFNNQLADAITFQNKLLDKEKLDEAKYNEVEKVINNLQFIQDNWDKVKDYHKENSHYLKVSKEAIDDSETDEEDNPEQQYDNENNKASYETASNRVLYTIASLPKYINGEAVPNNFIPLYFQENENGKVEDFINPDVVDFDRTWNLLSKTLQGITDYGQIVSKITQLAEKNPEFNQLLAKLPNPTKDLTKNELDIRNRFIQDLSKPLVPAYRTSFYTDSEGNLHVKVNKSGATVSRKIKEESYSSFQNRPEDTFTKLNPETNLNELNTEEILKEFPKSLIEKSEKRRLEFLQAIGFEFSDNTIANLKDKLDPKKVVSKDDVIYIWDAVKQYNDNVKDIPLTNPLNQLSKNITDKEGKVLFSGVQSNIDAFIDKEAEFNDNYYSDNILNAKGDNKYQIQQWSLQSIIYSYLNDVEKYPTYQDLKDSPVGYIFDIYSNPDADNIYLNSIFDLNTGQRRTDKNGNPITIQLIEQDGLEIQESGENTGLKSVELSRVDKFLQNFTGLLTNGLQSHVRVGDKNSEKATKFDHFINENGEDTGFLPVPIKHFVNNEVPDSAKRILKKMLASELQRSKDVLYSNEKDFKNLNVNAKNLGFFDGIIHGELWDNLKEQLKTKSPETLIKDNQKAIDNAIDTYFKAQIKENEKELGDNKLPKEITWNKETALRAYTVNSWILNGEQFRLQIGDVRFYPAKEGKIEEKKEPFKRISKAISTGSIFVNDAQTNNALSKLFPRLQAIKVGLSGDELGYIPSVIFNDIIKESAFISNYRSYWLNVAKQSKEVAEKLIDPFKNINIGDGQGWITLDQYRALKLKQGSDHWTNDHEEAYKEAVNPTKPVDYNSLERFNTLFSVVKVRYTGWVKDDKTGKAVPVDYKFSLLPLLPQAIKGTEFESIHNSMIKQGVGIALFESGSKHSAILNPDGKFNEFKEGNYTINPLNYEFLFDVLNVEPEFKDELRIPVQKRRLLYLNQFDNGVPIDYKKGNWNNLSEEEKKKESPIYRSHENFKRIIDKQTEIEIDNLLHQLGAKLNKETNTYDLDQEKFSQLLENEFLKRGLPDNVIESIKVVDGKFKYPLDASVVRQTIETVVLSIIDNRIRKQKGFGEALVVGSDAGLNLTNPTKEELEKYGTTDLSSYQYEGRTLSDGTKVTSASKVKLSIGVGDFKKLLKLSSLEGKKFQDYPEPLKELNKAIKEDRWLNQGNNRALVTLTADKIPIQGDNSMEFFEVYEFLPEGTMALIIAPEIVAKSGVDFDVDKLFTLLPSIYIDETDTPKLFTELTNSQIRAKYEAIAKQFSIEKGVSEKSTEETEQIIEDLFNKIFGGSIAEDIKQYAKDSFGLPKFPDLNTFTRIYQKAALNNSLNQEIRKILQQSSNFGNLMHPNSTEMFEPYADELRKTKLGNKRNYWSDILTTKENLNQLASSYGSRASLGIGAVANTFFSQMQSIGMYLENEYKNNWGTPKKTIIRLPHNTVKVKGKEHISISGKYDHRKQAGKPPYNTISEAISQLMNGWVDAAKKDWVYYMNGIKEIAPTQLYMLMTGIDAETMTSFTNQPIIDDYIKELKKNKSLINKLTNKGIEAKREALTTVYEKYLPWEKSDNGDLSVAIEDDVFFKDEIRGNTPTKMGLIPTVYIIKSKLSKSSDTNDDIFKNEFLRPVALGEVKPDGKTQAEILTHFLELQEQSNIMTNLQSATNADRSKPQFIYASNIRKGKLNLAKQQELFPPELIDKMTEKSTISAFLSQERGIDALITKLFGNKVFDVTNHPNFNKFIERQWDNDKDIPFNNKFEIQEDWFKKIKNDFISFLYQNYVHELGETELTVDKVRDLMTRKRGADKSLSSQLKDIIKNYPELVKKTTLLNQLAIDNSRIQDISNIKLKKSNIDRDLANLLTSDFQYLLTYSEGKTPEDNEIIQNFAKNLANFGFIQSGLTKSPLYFTNIIPQDFYANNIGQTIKDYSKLLDNPEKVKDDLNKFYYWFKKNNAYKFYTISQEYDEETGQVGKNITPTKEPYRFSPYKVGVSEEVSDKKELNIALKQRELEKEKEELYNKVDNYNPETTDAGKEPSKIFIYSTNSTDSGLAGSATIKGNAQNPHKNTLGIPTKNKASNREDAYFTDSELEKNKLLIDNAINSIKERAKNYEKIAFPETLLDGVNKLSEKAPLTANYLSQKLKTEFNYIDKNATFDSNTIPLESQEQPIVEETKETPTQEVVDSNELQKQNIKGIEINSYQIGLGNSLTNVHYAKNGKSAFDIVPSDKSLKLTQAAKAKWGESVEAWYKSNNAQTKGIPEGVEGDKHDFNLMVGLITDKLTQYPDLVKQINERGGLEFLQKSTHNMGTGRWSSKNPKNMFMNSLIQAYKNTSQVVDSGIDKQLNEKIKNKLQQLYPQIKLDITDSPIWEKGDEIFNQEDKGNKFYRVVNLYLGEETGFLPSSYTEQVEDYEGKHRLVISKYGGFKRSQIPETSASKSIGAALMGNWSASEHPQEGTFYIYEINTKPDVDLSSQTGYDFETLKEVRYRKPVNGKLIGSIKLTPEIINLFNENYNILTEDGGIDKHYQLKDDFEKKFGVRPHEEGIPEGTNEKFNKFQEDWYNEFNSNLEKQLQAIHDKYVKNQIVNGKIIGQANIKAMSVLIDAVNQKQDTLPHEYAHHYIAWYRNTPIVQEAIKKWGSEEALVQSIGEQVVKQKGEAFDWWNKFVKWILDKFNSLSKLQKEELTQILTDAFLTNTNLNSGIDESKIDKNGQTSLFGLDLQNEGKLEFHINTLNVISQFLENVGVSQRLVPEFLSKDGNVVEGALAAANFIDGTVDIIEDLEKRPEAWNKLPEEAAHFWYRLLNNSPFKKQLFSDVRTVNRANELGRTLYGKEYKSIVDLSEEAVGQLVAETIKRLETKTGAPEDYSFWRKFVDWLNSVINTFKQALINTDPFEVAAMKILTSDLSDLMSWEEYNKLNKLIYFSEQLDNQSTKPIDYTLIDDLVAIDNMGHVRVKDTDNQPPGLVTDDYTFDTDEERDMWTFKNYGDILIKRQEAKLQQVRDNQKFFDRLLNKTFRKRSKFLPKTLAKYYTLVDAQNLNELQEWNIDAEIPKITKKLTGEEKKLLVQTNNYTNIAPTLKVLPDLLKKYSKHPIVLSEPIKIDGAKKQELNILNGIKDLIKHENPDKKTITSEEFVNEAHNWLETNYLLGFANEQSYLSYRTDQTFEYIRDRQTNEDVDLTNMTDEQLQQLPFEERRRIANIVGLTKKNPDVYHNKISLRFNDKYHLKSGHFNMSPSAWGNLTYFYTGKSKLKDAVLLHEIQNDNIESLREFKTNKTDLEQSLGRYLQNLNNQLVENIQQIESGGKKIQRTLDIQRSHLLKDRMFHLQELIIDTKDSPINQGLQQFKERIEELINLFQTAGDQNSVEKQQEKLDKVYSDRRRWNNFLKVQGGLKSILSSNDLMDLKEIIQAENTKELTGEEEQIGYVMGDGVEPSFRSPIATRKKEFSAKAHEINRKINNKIRELYGDDFNINLALEAPAKLLPKANRRPKTVTYGRTTRITGNASQYLDDNINWLIAYNEKKVLENLSKNIEQAKKDYIFARNRTASNNFNKQLSKITLEQYTNLIENYKYNQDLLSKLVDAQSNKELKASSLNDQTVKQIKESIVKIGDVLDRQTIKAIVSSEAKQDINGTILKTLKLVKVVLPIYEEKYPNDSRIRDCIEATIDYIQGKISREELQQKRNAAAYAAAAAADAAADAAAYAAYAAAAAAADAYAYAAADAYAYAAADAYAYAADAAYAYAYADAEPQIKDNLKNTFIQEFGQYFAKYNNTYITGQSKEDVSDKVDDFFNPVKNKAKQEIKFETLKEKALSKQQELDKEYGKIEEEVKQTLEVEMNYFTPLIHHLIQKHISQYGKDFPMYFAGYNITKLTQGNDRTALIYAGKDEITTIPKSDFEIKGKPYFYDSTSNTIPLVFTIGNTQFRHIRDEFSTRENGALKNITEQEYNKAKEEYEKAYQQATEQKAKEIKAIAALNIGIIKISDFPKMIQGVSESTNISKLTSTELDNIIKKLNEYKKQSKQNLDRVVNTIMNISNNKPIETGALYNAMSQVSGVKLIWQDEIQGLKGNPGGYLVDLSNYNYNTPILYGLQELKPKVVDSNKKIEEDKLPPLNPCS